MTPAPTAGVVAEGQILLQPAQARKIRRAADGVGPAGPIGVGRNAEAAGKDIEHGTFLSG